MLPPEHQYDWHTDGLTLRGHDKEFSESLLGAVVAEWSELTGLKQTDTERVQALIYPPGRWQPAHGLPHRPHTAAPPLRDNWHDKRREPAA